MNGVYAQNAKLVYDWKPFNKIPHINIKGEKNHMIISIYTETAFNKILYRFMKEQTLSIVREEGNFLSLKMHKQNTYSKHHTQRWNAKCFLPAVSDKARISTLTVSIQHCTQNWSHCNNTKKSHHDRKRKIKLSLFKGKWLCRKL